jgi:hypothetical protein
LTISRSHGLVGQLLLSAGCGSLLLDYFRCEAKRDDEV